MWWVLQELKLIRLVLRTKDRPRQLAAGIACGLLLGLLPKGNLLAVAVATALMATRMSLATGLLCALLVSLVAPWLDPVTHPIGQWLLGRTWLLGLWTALARLPLASWTAFSNTVVMGSLVLGLGLWYPVYRLTLPWMERLGRALEQAEQRDAAAVPDEPEPVTLALPSAEPAEPWRKCA